MPDFYPDIYEHLELSDNSKSVSTKGLDELILIVRASTGLNYDVCLTLVKYFFQEIMNGMLRGDKITLKGLGKFYIASPLTGNRNIIPRFIPYKSLTNVLNEEDK